MLTMIPLSSLKLSSKNARKTERKAALEELKASIKTHGLLENLVITEGRNGRHEVVAGGRRLLALKALQEEDHLATDHRVPCHLVDSGDAREVSLAENIVRVAMHPYDQFMAWKALANAGSRESEVAERFGVSEQLVAKRLKLARVAPALLKAYRDGEMSLEQLEAFTLTQDHGR
jgi:ParB family transcriptional regulator, chromosome partitioning protein